MLVLAGFTLADRRGQRQVVMKKNRSTSQEIAIMKVLVKHSNDVIGESGLV